jgi:hypothetical protein
LFQSLKQTAAETHRMLQEAFADNATSQSKTFLWYRRFKDGRTSVDDNERSGRPSTSTAPETANVREATLADRRQTIHYVCEIVGLSYGTVQRILADHTHKTLKTDIDAQGGIRTRNPSTRTAADPRPRPCSHLGSTLSRNSLRSCGSLSSYAKSRLLSSIPRPFQTNAHHSYQSFVHAGKYEKRRLNILNHKQIHEVIRLGSYGQVNVLLCYKMSCHPQEVGSGLLRTIYRYLPDYTTSHTMVFYHEYLKSCTILQSCRL